MKRTLSLVCTLVVGLSTAAYAQTTAAPTASAPAPAQPAAPVIPPPQAFPAKIALIAFQEAVLATNEGQSQMAELAKKYEPRKAKIDALNTELQSLQKQLQATTLTDEERAARVRTGEAKERELKNEQDDAQAAYNADLQDTFTKVAGKVFPIMTAYVSKSGFTLVLDVSNQQTAGMVMWAADGSDITKAIIDAYNAQSPAVAPPPAAPRRTTGTTAKPTTPAKPAATTPATH